MCLFASDGPAGENEYIFAKLSEFTVDAEDGGKPRFEFRLPSIGVVCREAWILALGFPNRNNSRVRSLEAMIRRGESLPRPKNNKINRGLTSSDFGQAFLIDYILKHSQRSPVTTDLCAVIFLPAYLCTTHH